jgi:hypothetical protein
VASTETWSCSEMLHRSADTLLGLWNSSPLVDFLPCPLLLAWWLRATARLSRCSAGLNRIFTRVIRPAYGCRWSKVVRWPRLKTPEVSAALTPESGRSQTASRALDTSSRADF